MNLTLELLAVAAVGLALATVAVYESYIRDLRVRLDRATRHAEDSQVLLDAVTEEAEARRRYPAGKALPWLSVVRDA